MINVGLLPIYCRSLLCIEKLSGTLHVDLQRTYSMQNRITNRTAETANPKEKPYEIRDADIKGFLLRVQPSGIKTYYYSFRAPDGKKQRIWIGKHGSITCAQARDAAEIHAGKVALGENVQAEKKQ